MEEEEKERYFCPFAQQICSAGLVVVARENTRITDEIICQFWDTRGPGRCWLLLALAGLTTLSQIASDLQTLAGKD